MIDLNDQVGAVDMATYFSIVIASGIAAWVYATFFEQEGI